MAELKKTHRYDDIIHMSHPISVRHAPMSNGDRAAQFSPFSALTGYEEVLAETARLTMPKIELEESELQILNERLQYLLEHAQEQPMAQITYFVHDRLKSGGAYQTIIERVKKIDAYDQAVILVTGQQIAMCDIIQLTCS